MQRIGGIACVLSKKRLMISAQSERRLREDLRCTSASDGRLSRYLFRVLEAKSDGIWICCWDWNESMFMKEFEGGEESNDDVVEISESERLRFRTDVIL